LESSAAPPSLSSPDKKRSRSSSIFSVFKRNRDKGKESASKITDTSSDIKTDTMKESKDIVAKSISPPVQETTPSTSLSSITSLPKQKKSRSSIFSVFRRRRSKEDDSSTEIPEKAQNDFADESVKSNIDGALERAMEAASRATSDTNQIEKLDKGIEPASKIPDISSDIIKTQKETKKESKDNMAAKSISPPPVQETTPSTPLSSSLSTSLPTKLPTKQPTKQKKSRSSIFSVFRRRRSPKKEENDSSLEIPEKAKNVIADDDPIKSNINDALERAMEAASQATNDTDQIDKMITKKEKK